MGVTWCVFTAAGSLCQACFGSTAEGTTGRKRSVLLLTLATALALWFQYSVGPAIVTRSGLLWKIYSAIPGMGPWLYKSWHESCAERYDDDLALLQQCAGKAGVLRPMAVAALFFALQAGATKVQPSLNREAWPAKYCLYLLGVFCSFFMGNAPLFTGVFLWLARLGATLFVVLQQGKIFVRVCLAAWRLPSFRPTWGREDLRFGTIVDPVSLTLYCVPSLLFLTLARAPVQSFSLTLPTIGTRTGWIGPIKKTASRTEVDLPGCTRLSPRVGHFMCWL
jgi:hypothetical protein